MATNAGPDEQSEEPVAGPAPPASAAAPPPNRPAYRALSLVAGLGLAAVGLWLGVKAFSYGGPVLAPPLLVAGAAAALAAGILLIVKGLLRPAELDEQTQVAQQVARLGLPTEPAAYQNGGLAVAATARFPPEAELIAQELKRRGIPAWVDQSHAAITLSHAQFAINPEGVRVLVPHGRLPDAQSALAQLGPRKAGAAGRGCLGDEEEDDAAGRAFALRRRAMVVAFMGAGAFVFSVPLLGYAIWLTMAARRAQRIAGPSPVLVSAFRWAVVAIAMCVIGVVVSAGLLLLMTTG